jgi:hypothetical protein
VTLGADLVVGREGADLNVPDAELSRRHFAIRRADGAVVVEDLGSTNGTAVDGRRITGPVQLTRDATVQAGQTVLTIAFAEDRAVASIATSPAEKPRRRGLPAFVPWALAAGAIAALVVVALTSGSSSKTKTITTSATVSSASTLAPGSVPVTRSAAQASALDNSRPQETAAQLAYLRATPPLLCPYSNICLQTLASGILQTFGGSRNLISGPNLSVSISGPLVFSVRVQSMKPGAVEPWHRHPGSAMIILRQGTVTEYTESGNTCVVATHSAPYARWEPGDFAHELVAQGQVLIESVSFDPIGSKNPIIRATKPPNCPR